IYSIHHIIKDIEKHGKITSISQEFDSQMEYLHCIIPGTLHISNGGVVKETLLILQGPEKGTIWIYYIDKVYPMEIADKKRVSFTEYYLDWLNKGLEQLENYEPAKPGTMNNFPIFIDKTIQKKITEIKTKLDLLIAIDKFFLYSVSAYHKYEKLPPLSLEEVAILEEKLQITLPEDFRAFITQVASGGAGPSYGLYSIRHLINRIEKSGKLAFLSKEFVYSNDMKYEDVNHVSYSDGISHDNLIYFSDRNTIIPGSLTISNCGCAIEIILVLQGPEKGNIWIDEGGYMISPGKSDDKKRITFTDYYLNWLNRGLKELEAYEPKNIYPNDYPIVEQIIQNYRNQVNDKPIKVLLQKFNSKRIVFYPEKTNDSDYEYINDREMILDIFPDIRCLKKPPVDDNGTEIRRIQYKLYAMNTDFLRGSIDLFTIEINSSNDIIGLEFYKRGYTPLIELFQGLQTLKYLFIDGGQISSLPSELSKLNKLEYFGISHNTLEIIPTSILDLENIKLISLTSNRINSIPGSITTLKHLQGLNLSSNFISAIPPEIGNIEQLHELFIDNNLLSEFPKNVLKNKTLICLSVGFNKIRVIPKEIKVIESLKQLNLIGNPLESVPEELFIKLKLKVLGLDIAKLTYTLQAIQLLATSTIEELLMFVDTLEEVPKELNMISNLKTLRIVYKQNNVKNFQVMKEECIKLNETLTVENIYIETLDDVILYGSIKIKVKGKNRLGSLRIKMDMMNETK
ncbi:MAG: SMI1/KNR4 family protein, partial [Candidatus Thorarchaeota archaeon]